MSQLDDNNSTTAVLEPTLRGRAAVMATEQADVSLMDPAHKALVDALRITYLLVRVAMVGLVILFLVSGFQRVNTGESGISLRFGQVRGTDLAPGLHPSWPYPIGELIKVSTAPQEATIEFLPELSQSERRELREKGPTALAGGGLGQLGVQDSYLLTADQAIGHAQWQLRWRRATPNTTAQNIDDADLSQIVQAVVRNAILRAAATSTIDEVIRATPEPWRNLDAYEPLADAARRMAQEKLDEMDSGVEISQLALTTKFPPRHVINDFNSVSNAEQEAARTIAAAQTARERTLTETAGAAAETILAQIEQYERDLAAGDDSAAAATFARIAALLRGQPVTIDGREVAFPVSGRVASITQEAEQFESEVVASARTDAATFQAKLAAFKANPDVMIHTDWTDALTALFTNESVQALLFDTTGDPTFVLNRDPEIARELERRRNQRKRAETIEQRQREMERQRFEREPTTTPSEQ